MKKLLFTLGMVASLSTMTFAQTKTTKKTATVKKEVTEKKAVVAETKTAVEAHGPNDGHNHGATNPVVAPTSLADISFEKTVHDYGTIKQGGNGECEFVFKTQVKSR